MMKHDTTQPAPLMQGEDGTIRIVGSRVTLDSIVDEFKGGATVEQIQEDFPTLALRDIYCAIAYYLSNKASVEAYLRSQERAGEQVRAEVERHGETRELRERLGRLRAGAVA